MVKKLVASNLFECRGICAEGMPNRDPDPKVDVVRDSFEDGLVHVACPFLALESFGDNADEAKGKIYCAATPQQGKNPFPRCPYT